MVWDFGSDSISIIETGNDEVGSSSLIGQHPARGVVAGDNSRLYVSNFGSNSVAVYDIDIAKLIATMPLGSRPQELALSKDQRYLLVLYTRSARLTLIHNPNPRNSHSTRHQLLTHI